ncbi:MAG: TlpA disulfide reductase family protein [Cyclobacteriaceae bacterium]
MSKKIRKEIREWIILLTVVGVLFWTGWYKDVASLLQRGLLETGLLSPDKTEVVEEASYDFQLVNAGGKTINFSDFEGETVFMNVWATWCPPCIAEMPDIHDLYEKVGKEVTFIMLSVDDDPETAMKFVERKGFEFPVYFLKTNLPPEYSSSTIPSTFVISPEGKIVVRQHGLSKYDSKSFREFLLSL